MTCVWLVGFANEYLVSGWLWDPLPTSLVSLDAPAPSPSTSRAIAHTTYGCTQTYLLGPRRACSNAGRAPISQTSLQSWHSSTALRNYISPKITSLDTISTFVFGLRFSFVQKNHVTWWSQAHLNKVLQDNGIGVSISNSTCNSGWLAIAEYILFKALNTTHQVWYLQSIRNHRDACTPFFNIVLHKRTPTDDQFHHLVVIKECGENHVTPLTAPLSSHPTG